MRLRILIGAVACAAACAAAEEFPSSTMTNVATFLVQVTNRTTFAMTATNLFERPAAPAATNEVALAATNAAARLPSPAETNLARRAAMDAVASAIKAVNAAAAAERRRMVSTRTFRLQYAAADEVAEKFNTMWNGDFGLPWKLSRIAQPFPEANSVMVTAPGIILDACAEAVREIDREPRQVYIEARFVELSNQAFHRLGIDWSMLNGMKGTMALNAGYNERKMEGVTTYDSATGAYTINTASEEGGGLNSANLSYVNATLGMSDLYMVLKALEGSTDARTFSNPKIIVASGRKATVDMTTKYPNVTVAVKRTINDSTQSIDLDMKMAAIPGEDSLMFAKEAFFSWGISLDVTPRVISNDVINVEIVPTISSLDTSIEPTGFVQASDSATTSSKYPVIGVQRLLTEFNMASGTTAVIGGLSRTVEEQVDTGIPWLRDWWWIGPRLFGGKERVKTQREIIVFVTVGLVDPRKIDRDAGLPMNAVLGRQYTEGVRHEPGERKRQGIQGMDSLDLRSLEEQAHDPRRTNVVQRTFIDDVKGLPKGQVPAALYTPFKEKVEID